MAHACCHTALHSAATPGTAQTGEAAYPLVSCPAEGAAQSVMACCHDEAQAEQNATVSLRKPAPVVSAQLLVSLDGQLVSVPPPYNSNQLYRTRPLYLSSACFLI